MPSWTYCHTKDPLSGVSHANNTRSAQYHHIMVIAVTYEFAWMWLCLPHTYVKQYTPSTCSIETRLLYTVKFTTNINPALLQNAHNLQNAIFCIRHSSSISMPCKDIIASYKACSIAQFDITQQNDMCCVQQTAWPQTSQTRAGITQSIWHTQQKRT